MVPKGPLDKDLRAEAIGRRSGETEAAAGQRDRVEALAGSSASMGGGEVDLLYASRGANLAALVDHATYETMVEFIDSARALALLAHERRALTVPDRCSPTWMRFQRALWRVLRIDPEPTRAPAPARFFDRQLRCRDCEATFSHLVENVERPDPERAAVAARAGRAEWCPDCGSYDVVEATP